MVPKAQEVKATGLPFRGNAAYGALRSYRGLLLASTESNFNNILRLLSLQVNGKKRIKKKKVILGAMTVTWLLFSGIFIFFQRRENKKLGS